MQRKTFKAVSIFQILLCIVAYISMSIHFDSDYKVYHMLANTDFLATMLRLSLYAIPGMHLLSGLYGLIIEEKKLLIAIGTIELVCCLLTFTFIGSSTYMLILSIISSFISIVYLACIVANKQ